MTKDTVTVIFVHGDSLVDKIIDFASHGQYSHTAMKICGQVIEALGENGNSDQYPGVWFHSIDKYDNNPNVKMIDVELPDLPSAELEANRLIGKPYSYLSCLTGGLNDMFGIKLSGDSDLAYDCSKLVAHILRAGGYVIDGNTPDSDITPMDDERELARGCD